MQVGAPAIQAPRRNEFTPAEDCLFLNVWTPASNDRKRPVMLHSHGGIPSVEQPVVFLLNRKPTVTSRVTE